MPGLDLSLSALPGASMKLRNGYEVTDSRSWAFLGKLKWGPSAETCRDTVLKLPKATRLRMASRRDSFIIALLFCLEDRTEAAKSRKAVARGHLRIKLR